ncbi:hypothetical protein [Rubrolithibacter danxiaensis]|uniref:hypothetical protein n=1 Tax=Rubrolithibacter danxiaensis TaxID=3390805 RepID=UPI003BF8DF0B
MQETTTFRIDEEIIRLIKPESLQATLYHQISKNTDKVQEMIARYYFQSRGRVFDLRIPEKEFSVNATGDGLFTAYYQIGVFNSCADIDLNYEEKMRVILNFNAESGITMLNGEEIPEREPDEI